MVPETVRTRYGCHQYNKGTYLPRNQQLAKTNMRPGTKTVTIQRKSDSKKNGKSKSIHKWLQGNRNWI